MGINGAQHPSMVDFDVQVAADALQLAKEAQLAEQSLEINEPNPADVAPLDSSSIPRSNLT